MKCESDNNSGATGKLDKILKIYIMSLFKILIDMMSLFTGE